MNPSSIDSQTSNDSFRNIRYVVCTVYILNLEQILADAKQNRPARSRCNMFRYEADAICFDHLHTATASDMRQASCSAGYLRVIHPVTHPFPFFCSVGKTGLTCKWAKLTAGARTPAHTQARAFCLAVSSTSSSETVQVYE